MAYIDESWSNEQKALVMADEALNCIVDQYNYYVKLSKTRPLIPEEKTMLKSFTFAASHAAAVRDECVRKALPQEILDIVDADAKKQNIEFDKFMEKYNTCPTKNAS